MRCTATLTTATVTDVVTDQDAVRCPSRIEGNWCLRPVGHEGRCRYGTADHHRWKIAIPDGETVQRQGDRLVRVDLHTLTCHGPRPHSPTDDHFYRMADGGVVVLWMDPTPGATPHTPLAVTVTDAELDAAERATRGHGLLKPPNKAIPVEVLRAALEAAAKVRQQGDGT